MKKWNQFLILGTVGFLVSLTLFAMMKLVGVEYHLAPYILPWIVFLIIGISKRKYVSN
ncbi:MAG: hypothetical protein AB8B73_11740 [Ekhidna sp.]